MYKKLFRGDTCFGEINEETGIKNIKVGDLIYFEHNLGFSDIGIVTKNNENNRYTISGISNLYLDNAKYLNRLSHQNLYETVLLTNKLKIYYGVEVELKNIYGIVSTINIEDEKIISTTNSKPKIIDNFKTIFYYDKDKSFKEQYENFLKNTLCEILKLNNFESLEFANNIGRIKFGNIDTTGNTGLKKDYETNYYFENIININENFMDILK